jgi:predicted AlkP superfamily pyrophosphatase or phosphodiesterase
MSRVLRFAAVLAALVLGACATWSPAPPSARPLVVLISIDGFRADYLDRGVTPALSKLAAQGVRAAMRPSFPSKTFPNHYAIVTGLRPDRNGIVDNNIYDPRITAEEFTMSKVKVASDPRWWNEALPIWVSAERQGVRTATMFWPGSDVTIRGGWPAHWKLFDMKTPPEARVDQALAWMDEKERPRFLTVYFDDVDTAGHDFGPDSPELNAAAARVDGAVARLLEGLKARGIAANVIVVADHGMAATSPDRRIYADDLMDMKAVKTVTMGAFMSLYVQPGRTPDVEAALLKPHAHMQCWRKDRIPARYHYGKNPRVPPYFCLPETGWEITTHAYKPKKPQWGNHGYDPYAPEMAAVFVASGPAFRRGVALASFDNVDVYPLLTRLLGVRGEPGDGRLADLQDALTR